MGGCLWGCAFEDLLERNFDGEHAADDYLKRRGWNEKIVVKDYIRAPHDTPMSLYEVSAVVPGILMCLRDMLQDRETVTVQENSATQFLHNWDRIATRIIRGRNGFVISGALLAFSAEASTQLINGFASIAARPDPELDFNLIDLTALLRYSAPLFTATWLMDAAGAMQAPPPQLVNSDGDDIMFHRLVFPLSKGVTQKQVAARLGRVPSLSPASTKSGTGLSTRGPDQVGLERQARKCLHLPWTMVDDTW